MFDSLQVLHNRLNRLDVFGMGYAELQYLVGLYQGLQSLVLEEEIARI